ncbi:MAG: carboxylating nicotinate-nucleotide diphosphorylase [Bacteroidia bacterium]|nr:carboxylating nicotinate-nucleotide diphosphorylase [Bacteroidia bacterium]MDW8236613.1 carboxylating nicotinate-nucleotide diphosphorylase [Bacteroidia bacterium]
MWDSEALRFLLQKALEEDLGIAGDITSLAAQASQRQAIGKCIAKDTGVIAGIAIAKEVYQILDKSVSFREHLADGAPVEAGSVLFEVYGNAYTLLVAERLVLNLMQRLSGIATQARMYVQALAGTACRVLDTRKTTPLWRALEKWAVQLGGGVNHRMGLYDQFLIKDNHIDLMGGIRPAIEAVLAYKEKQGISAPIVVEVRNFPEIEQALQYVGQIDRLLLDNFEPYQVARAVRHIAGRIPVEVSGGITPENVRAYAEAGADFVSAGALTHSVRALDLHLKIRPV